MFCPKAYKYGKALDRQAPHPGKAPRNLRTTLAMSDWRRKKGFCHPDDHHYAIDVSH